MLFNGSDDFGSAGALYTVNINTGALTLVGTIQKPGTMLCN
jgi:hypothetical protein